MKIKELIDFYEKKGVSGEEYVANNTEKDDTLREVKMQGKEEISKRAAFFEKRFSEYTQNKSGLKGLDKPEQPVNVQDRVEKINQFNSEPGKGKETVSMPDEDFPTDSNDLEPQIESKAAQEI